jgi:non-ribosomal peptide synthetase component F
MAVRPVVCHDVETSTLAAVIDQEIAAPPIPADLPTRVPELHHSLLRMGAIAVCLAVEESKRLSNPGLIAHFNGGRLTLRFDAGQISKKDAGAVADFLFGNNPETPPPQAESASFVPQRISRWAETSPAAVAIEGAGQRLSYADLEQRSNALASKLYDCGAAKEILIAVLLPQGCDFVVSTVAVLKSGAAYLPLEISTPLHRLRDIVHDARPLAVITDQNHMDLALQLGVAVVRADDGVMAGQPTSLTTTQGDDLAYVIYTSGSTGKPKGVAMPHRPLVTLLRWQSTHLPCATGTRTLQYTTLSFDVSFQEIASTLVAGGCLILIRDEIRRNGVELLNFLIEHHIEFPV